MLRVIAAVALVASASSSASAQDDPEAQAREVFEQGRTAFNAGQFEEALGHFRRSYELSGKPELLFNIGVAADRLRLNQEALRAFESYLEQLPDAANRAEVEGRIRVLRSALIANPSEAARATPPPQSQEPIIVVFEEEDSLWTSWWFWTIVGGVVVGGVVAAILLTSVRDPQYMTGDDGLVHFTLEAP